MHSGIASMRQEEAFGDIEVNHKLSNLQVFSMNIHVKFLSSEAFSSAQNAANIVQRLGSAHPSGGAYSTPPDPLAG